MSGGEIIVIFLVILLLFGSEKLPDLMRTFGKGVNEFQKAKEEIQRELSDATSVVRQESKELKRAYENEIKTVQDDLNVKQSVVTRPDRQEDGFIHTAFGSMRADEAYGINDESLNENTAPNDNLPKTSLS